MPTYNLYREAAGTDECWWVYALDEWDARDQIERTLGIDAQNAALYECNEDVGLTVPLHVIVGGNGKKTNVRGPDIEA
jgi:hypothetical protein